VFAMLHPKKLLPCFPIAAGAAAEIAAVAVAAANTDIFIVNVCAMSTVNF